MRALTRAHRIQDFCHEFKLLDLRSLDNCLKAVAGCDHIYNLAADMGGMGFIQSNQSVLFYNNTMIRFVQRVEYLTHSFVVVS
jgi:GDP-D-mannose 3',5'-epimerase